MPEAKSIGLDTSIILRLLIGEPISQFKKAKEYVEKGLSQGKVFLVSDLVVSEVYFALQYHYKVPKKEAIIKLKSLLSSGVIHPSPDSVCLKVFKNIDKHKAGFVDQLIHAQYLLVAKEVVSFDKSMGALGNTMILG